MVIKSIWNVCRIVGRTSFIEEGHVPLSLECPRYIEELDKLDSLHENDSKRDMTAKCKVGGIVWVVPAFVSGDIFGWR
jgi:hypothetical protein